METRGSEAPDASLSTMTKPRRILRRHPLLSTSSYRAAGGRSARSRARKRSSAAGGPNASMVTPRASLRTRPGHPLGARDPVHERPHPDALDRPADGDAEAFRLGAVGCGVWQARAFRGAARRACQGRLRVECPRASSGIGRASVTERPVAAQSSSALARRADARRRRTPDEAEARPRTA